MDNAWGKPYGWRTGEQYAEAEASVADVIRHEINELGNTLLVHANLFDLETIPASHALWLCKTREAARQYGTPHKVFLSDTAFIAASDNDSGYLVID